MSTLIQLFGIRIKFHPDNLTQLANSPSQAEYLLYNLEQSARGISSRDITNLDKTKCMSFNQDGAISSLNGKPLKLDQFIYLSSNISSTESDVNIGKAWTTIDRFNNHMEICSNKIK